MTTHKKLKTLVRARMDKTGEAYTVARRHVLNSQTGYRLFGGLHPETASLANLLANRGISDPTTATPISEAMVLGIGGGLGAGYILWVSRAPQDCRTIAVVGFRNQFQYPDRWIRKTCDRIGVPVTVYETAGPRSAAKHLDSALDQGLPALAFISTAELPFWHLPAEESGWWGYPLVVHGRDGHRLLVDDRAHRSIPLEPEDLAAARGRISSYRNRLVVPDAAATELGEHRLVAAVKSGIEDQIAHLSAKSDSFSLPALAKWARMLVDTRNPKAWSRVFADGTGLVSCLVQTVEGIDQVSIFGGNLRSLYADFLDQASRLTGTSYDDAANAYRSAATRWEAMVGVVMSVPAVATVVEADRRRRLAVAAGDDAAARQAAEESLAGTRADAGLGQAEMATLFAAMADALRDCHGAEVDALKTLESA